MGTINILVIIAITLFSTLMIMLLIMVRKKQPILEEYTIKGCLEEYIKKYKNYHLLELTSEIKQDVTQKNPLILIIGIMIVSFKFVKQENLLISYLLFLLCVIIIALFITRGPTIKKIILKNNVIELFRSNNEVQTYQLDNINIKYNMQRGRYQRFYIYFNNVRYYTTNYDYESFIAFAILVNLLKTNELEKINNLNDDDIKRLQQNFTYSE